jgi:DNA-3-methyladenine glycosylase I
MSYCDYCSDLPLDNVHRVYHDTLYGFPIESDDELFARFVLEINQAGLSWDTILKKEQNFREAYDQFQIKKVANYTEKDVERLLQNAGIIRNRLKINAAIYNARQIVALQEKYGSFSTWLEQQKCQNLAEWVKIFKKQFKFVGTEIVNEFLMSSGYLKGAHDETCSIFDKITKKQPIWKQN